MTNEKQNLQNEFYDYINRLNKFKDEGFKLIDRIGKLDINCTRSALDVTPVHLPIDYRFDGHGGEVVRTDQSQVTAISSVFGSIPAQLQAAPANSFIVYTDPSVVIAPPNRIVLQQNDQWFMGQTSNVMIRGGNSDNHEGLIEVRGDRQIHQFYRSRPDGPSQANNCCHGPFIFYQVAGGLLDHVSLYWGDDDCLDVFESSGITVQDCLIAEGIKTPNATGKGAIASRGQGISFMRNLFALVEERTPFFKDILGGDIVNNVAYNCVRDYEITSENGNPVTVDVECNIEIKGSLSSSFWQDFGVRKDPGSGSLKIFRKDNKVLSSASADCQSSPAPFWFDELSGPTIQASDPSNFTNTSNGCPRILKLDVCDTLAHVLTNAGASHMRDSLDSRIVSDVTNGTGSIVNSPGPWPAMTPVTKNPWDLSKPDKLSDQIKEECELDPSSHQNTTQTSSIGGNVSDFVHIINYCFGL